MLKTYITGIGNVSPQKTYSPKKFLEEITMYDKFMLSCIEPDYEQFIDSKLLRRMSRIMRISWTAAKICLEDAGIKIPDAIITGTGMGCLEDTEKFLLAIDENDEQLLPPTPFIQSTHNTIGAQIALLLNCTNYNITFTQRGIAFENALSDALSLLKEREYKQILVGGFDEMTNNQMVLYKRLNYFKTERLNNLELLNNQNPGTIPGEGAIFFTINSLKTDHCYAEIRDVNTFNHPTDKKEIYSKIEEFLSINSMSVKDIDLIITGMNGDAQQDKIYHEITNDLFTYVSVAYYKHLCGEYHTSSAFALWLAANILKKQKIPDIIIAGKFKRDSINNILIYNHYRYINHSAILISGCSEQ